MSLSFCVDTRLTISLTLFLLLCRRFRTATMHRLLGIQIWNSGKKPTRFFLWLQNYLGIQNFERTSDVLSLSLVICFLTRETLGRPWFSCVCSVTSWNLNYVICWIKSWLLVRFFEFMVKVVDKELRDDATLVPLLPATNHHLRVRSEGWTQLPLQCWGGWHYLIVGIASLDTSAQFMD